MLLTCFLWWQYNFTGGVDYECGPYSAIFPAGKISASFHINIFDDDIVERKEEFTLIINSSSLSNGVTVSNPGQATVTIQDEDCE